MKIQVKNFQNVIGFDFSLTHSITGSSSFILLGSDKIRYSLLLIIHIQVIMLQPKNLQLFLNFLLYLCNNSNYVEISYLLFWVLSPPN